MGMPIAVIGNNHVCPQIDPGPKPHVGGPVVTGQTQVRVNGIPVAVVGDRTLCVGAGCVDPIAGGSRIARIDGRAIARIGDPTSHGGKIVQGVPAVRVG